MANNNDNTTPDAAARARRGSFTTQTFNNIFNRSNSTSTGPIGPITTAAAQDQRRRMSINTLGLSGSSPSQTTPFPFGARRGSVSTERSDSVDESAIDDDDGPTRSVPNTPFTRRMSFGAQALRARTGNGSPGGEGSGFNWSEQLRSRAESSVSQTQRPSFSTFANGPKPHDRNKSVSEMPTPPVTVPAAAPAPARPARPQPDAFQERILKGDFYMD